MEKQRTDFFSKSGRRLLITFSTFFFSFFILFFDLNAQSPKTIFADSGKEESFFTNTDIEFKILLPGIKAQSVTIIEPESPYFRAIKKTGDAENKGCWLYVWFRFSSPGSYSLPDMTIYVGNKKESLSFAPVNISENPFEKEPRIIVTFPNKTSFFSDKADFSKEKPLYSTKITKSLSFTVSLQYCTGISSFDWELPKNALFSQTKDYSESAFKESLAEKEASKIIPLAEFTWQSLQAGLQTMPRMKMHLSSFSGENVEVIFPEFSVRFTEGSTLLADDKEISLFSEAFSSADSDDSLESGETGTKTELGARSGLGAETGLGDGKKISKEDCKKLALLYREEAKALLSKGKKIQARKAFEEELGLSSWLNRRFYFGDFGISLGCKLFSIPEMGAKEVSYISSGNAVIIKEFTGDWLFVKFGESEGWCKKDEVIVWTWETF